MNATKHGVTCLVRDDKAAKKIQISDEDDGDEFDWLTADIRRLAIRYESMCGEDDDTPWHAVSDEAPGAIESKSKICIQLNSDEL
jgi:hypothetical protein